MENVRSEIISASLRDKSTIRTFMIACMTAISDSERQHWGRFPTVRFWALRMNSCQVPSSFAVTSNRITLMTERRMPSFD